MNKFNILFKIIISALITLYIVSVLFIVFYSVIKDIQVIEHEEVYILNKNDALIDTVIAHMSIEEKLGQLFVATINNSSSDDKEKIDSIFQSLNLSGIVFKQTALLDRLIISNYLQARSVLPLFVGSRGDLINQKNCSLPIGKIINSTKDSAFAYTYLSKYVDILKIQDVNIDFTNSLNHIDNTNCLYGFSDDKELAVKQSSYFNHKLLNNKIVSCTNFYDSLFFVSDSLALDTLCDKRKEELSFSQFLSIQIPDKIIDSITKQSCIHNFAGFYRKYYNFEGLIVAPLHETPTPDDLKLIFESGAELFVSDGIPEKYIQNLKNLVENNVIAEVDIDRRLRRILAAKKWTRPRRRKLKSAEISYSGIFNRENIMLSWNLHKKSLTLVKNNKNVLPFINLLNSKTDLLILSNNKFSDFRQILDCYTSYNTQKISQKSKIRSGRLRNSDNIIVLIDTSYTLKAPLIKQLKRLNKDKNLIVISFGSNVEKLLFADAVVYAYNNHYFSQINAAQIIAGTVRARGKLIPALAGNNPIKTSYSTINRLKYTIPEAADFDHVKLYKVDSLINYAITKYATPGAQILAAKNGKVFFHKSYGYHTYSKRRRVKNTDVYDIASITKVAATTLAAMKLYQKGRINLTDSIKYYIDDTINCTIKNHQLLDFFIHKTGIQPNMPVVKYIMYMDSTTDRYDKYFTEKPDSVHTIKLANDYYFRKDYVDSIVFSLYNLEIDTSKAYQYSDANFNIIYDILKRNIRGSYVNYLNRQIYNPLQLQHIGFLPLRRFRKSQIIPTQHDRYWRKQLLHGTVHDESAALYGGVAGNAGLFSNANDIAIIFQMLLNRGTYANTRIFDKSTIKYFTTPPKNSKRALGFSLKQGAFGHTGFTGCVVWANPRTGFLFVFLSNRIHPRMMNKRLNRMKIRSRAYNLILQSAI